MSDVRAVALQPVPAADRDHFDWTSHPPLAAIMAALGKGEAMFVGGCVRDSLLGTPPVPGASDTPTDIDIATTLRPEATVAALEAAGIKAIPTGIEHGTITAVAKGFVAEITTLRADIDTDGRRAEVAFTTDWDEDWRRRDFTVNALYLTADRQLFDPAGGLAALDRQAVEFIGEPAARIEEDFLRILRFYRFSARYAADLDGAGRAACRDLRDGLDRISRERIGQEMMKILGGPRRAFILEVMAEDGILPMIEGSQPDLAAVRALGDQPAIPAPEVVLAALWPGAAPGAIARALRLSKAQDARRKAALSAAASIDSLPEERRARRLLYHFGTDAYRDGLSLVAARAGEAAEADPEAWLAAFAYADNWPVPVLPLAARDFRALGLEPGPVLGVALKVAEAAWIEQDFPMDAPAIAAIRDAAVAAARTQASSG